MGAVLFIQPADAVRARVPQDKSEAPSGMTVDQAINLAFKHYPEVQQAEEAVKAARARVGQRKSAYLPTLGIELQYTRLYPDPYITFADYGAMQLFPEDNYDGHLALSQTLWDFGRTSNKVRAAKYELAVAEKNADLVKTNLAYQTIKVYYAILLLSESADVQRQQVEALEKDLAFMQKKVESGTATDFDEHTMRVKVDGAKSQKTEIENDLNKEEIDLCRLTGLHMSELTFGEQYPASSIELNEDDLVSSALQNRFEMLIAKDLENQAMAVRKSIKSDNNPSLNLNVLYGQKNGFFPDIQPIQTFFTGNVGLSMPIFNGLRTYNQTKEALSLMNYATLRRIETEERITAEVLKAISDVRASAEKLKVTESRVKLAEEALGQAKVKNGSGLITDLDLLKADIGLSQAQLLHFQALHDYALYIISLKKSAGIMFWVYEVK